MRLIEIIEFSIILALFSSVNQGLFFQFQTIQKQIEKTERETESLLFISESFCNACEGKGFSSLEEWKYGCTALWKLDAIEWKIEEKLEGPLYCGKWKGPYGDGIVYYQK